MTRSLLLIGIAGFLAGCSAEPTASNAAPSVQAAASRAASASVEQDLATLRRVTAPFHLFQTATHAGWNTQITACMSDPTLGGMGYHFGNTALIDGTARVDAPQLLLYEPEKNGRFRLVAVEYIIPYTFHARSDTPPTLFGQKFTQNDVFQLWGLHVWVWKNNPSGLYASWNPEVNCDHAAALASMHHN